MLKTLLLLTGAASAYASGWGYCTANEPHVDECPEDWHHSAPLCSGSHQSPIDIKTEDAVEDNHNYALNVNYPMTLSGNFYNTGHGAQMTLDTEVANHTWLNAGPYGDNEYNLLQFHFHAPSEHTVNGVHADAELHMVHLNAATDFQQNDDPNQLAVIGIFFDVGGVGDNPLVETLLESFTTTGTLGTTQFPTEVALEDLLPANILDKYWTYPGSLTTPDCRETVTWVVLKTHVWASQNQVDRLNEVWGNYGNNRPVQSVGDRVVESYDASHVHWGYCTAGEPHVDRCPDKWQHEWPLCDGDNQSPIDIVTSATVEDPSLQDANVVSPSTYSGVFHNTGHGVQFSLDSASTDETLLYGASYNGNQYKLLQMHYHAPSEHTVDGHHADAELHMVHINKEVSLQGNEAPEQLAVLGLFIDIQTWDNPLIAALIDSLSSVTDTLDTRVAVSNWISSMDVLNPGSSGDYWTYPGSLTTPDCRETVTWVVFKEHVGASQWQIEKLSELWGSYGNNRPTQPLGARVVRSHDKWEGKLANGNIVSFQSLDSGRYLKIKDSGKVSGLGDARDGPAVKFRVHYNGWTYAFQSIDNPANWLAVREDGLTIGTAGGAFTGFYAHRNSETKDYMFSSAVLQNAYLAVRSSGQAADPWTNNDDSKTFTIKVRA